jgi:hypothetical protein
MDPSKHLHPSTSTLSTFAGGNARLWSFVSTHDMLAIELTATGRTAYLVLTGCSNVSLPVSWRSTSPELLFDADDSAAPVTFVDGAGVRVQCEGAVIQPEDPLWR